MTLDTLNRGKWKHYQASDFHDTGFGIAGNGLFDPDSLPMLLLWDLQFDSFQGEVNE